MEGEFSYLDLWFSDLKENWFKSGEEIIIAEREI